MPCLNCDAAIAGDYCASCGQRTDTAPLSIRGLVGRWLLELTGYEQPLLCTLRGLLRRPGVVATQFAAGHRVRYTNPVKLAITTTALQFLVGRSLGLRGPIVVKLGDSSPQWSQSLADAIASNTAPLFVLLMLPFLALAMHWCHRRERRVADELALVLFAYGIAALGATTFDALTAAVGSRLRGAALLPIAWTAWAGVAFHRSSAVRSIARTLLAHVVWILLLAAIALVIAGVAALGAQLF